MSLAFLQKSWIKKNNTYGDKINHTIESLNIIKRIKILLFIDPEYIKAVFEIIKLDVTNSNTQDKKFVFEYFEKIYMIYII